jgi:hypothetical protein
MMSLMVARDDADLRALFEEALAAGTVVEAPCEITVGEGTVRRAGTNVLEKSAFASAKPHVCGARNAAPGVCVLTAEEAIEIFVVRKERSGRQDQVATRLALRFDVTPRTVRDIWNLRTSSLQWTETTRQLWSSADVVREANSKHQCACAPEAQTVHGHGEWKLCAAWLVPGEELKRDEFDAVLDRILASAAPLTIE